jgi:O-antigen ligase
VAIAIAFYTFVIVSRLPDAFPQYRLALVSMAINVGAALLLPRARRSLIARPEVLAVAALSALILLGIPFSVWPGGTLEFLVNDYVRLVVFFGLILYAARSARDVGALVFGVLASAVYLTIGLLLTTDTTAGRPLVMTAYDANDVGFVLVCLLPFALVWAGQARGVHRYLGMAVALFIVFGIVRTGSRGGFICLLIVAPLAILKIRRGRAAVTSLAAGAAIVFAVTTPVSYWERMSTIWESPQTVDADGEDYDTAGLRGARLGVWENGLQLIRDNPFLGVGGGDFSVAEGALHWGLGKWAAPHNSFLQITAELGFGGLALFLYLLYRTIRNCRAVAARAHGWDGVWLAKAIEVALCGYIVAGSALSMAYSPVLYLLVAMSVALDHAAARRRPTAVKRTPGTRAADGVPRAAA